MKAVSMVRNESKVNPTLTIVRLGKLNLLNKRIVTNIINTLVLRNGENIQIVREGAGFKGFYKNSKKSFVFNPTNGQFIGDIDSNDFAIIDGEVIVATL